MEEEIFSTILSVSALLLLLSGVVVVVIINYKRKQQDFIREKKLLRESFGRQLLEAKVEMQEHTFGLIGSELHDNIGQLLGSASMLIGVASRSIPSIPPALAEAERTLLTAIKEVRALSKTFDKDWLSRFNLIENLHIAINRLNTSGEIKVQLITHAVDLPITTDQQLLLFRVIQEAIQNAIKHSSPSELAITIAVDEIISIDVNNNGGKFLPGAVFNEGLGILHMRQRTTLLGGTIHWNLKENGLCNLRIILPLPKPIT